MALDMSDGSAIEAFCDRFENEVPKLDILVNNAGVTWGAPVLEYPMDAWDRVYNVNVRGLWQLSQRVARGMKVITTNPDTAQPCPDDKVNRAFVADMPIQLWVSDFTCVSSWQGMVCVAFIIDVFARKIVGWRVSTSMTTGFVLDALNQAICQRTPSEADKLIHHSDRGSRYLSIRYTERLTEAGPPVYAPSDALPIGAKSASPLLIKAIRVTSSGMARKLMVFVLGTPKYQCSGTASTISSSATFMLTNL